MIKGQVRCTLEICPRCQEKPAVFKQAKDQKQRPHLLDLAVKILGQLEIVTDYRQTPYCHWLAQERLQVLLETEISKSRQADY